MIQNSNLQQIASQVRRDIVRMVHNASSGHPGGSLSSTELLVTLFFKEMKHNPKEWRADGIGSDLFFLSAGHMTPVYYSVLARSGYFEVEELNTFRVLGSRLQGHPSVDMALPGVHVATGSLGQGLSVATGAALAKKMRGEENFTYALIGDGESQEGQIWEAALFAAHKKLERLIVFTDWNGQQIDGTVEEVAGLGDLKKKWEAFGWRVIVIDGHNVEEISEAINLAKEGVTLGQDGGTSGDSTTSGRPTMILAKTVMGKGIDFMEGTHQWHGKAPSREECEKALSQLEESLGDF